MTDILSYPFMQRALIAAVLVGVVCSVIGTYVVLKKLAFIGAGISGGVTAGGAWPIHRTHRSIWSGKMQLPYCHVRWT